MEGLPEGVTLPADGPAVSLSFFCAALGALVDHCGNRTLGEGNEADEIRAHLGHIEEIYRRLPELAPAPRDKADELDRFVGVIERMRREAHDYGLEAFPDNFWESCEVVEGVLRAAADAVREEVPK